MKLIIQIPCLNEAGSLPLTLSQLPREVPGFDEVRWLVIDDGSTDGTAGVARECGVDHIISLPHNQGLARAFMTGVETCLRLGADVIVNTDADNQYSAESIPDLVAPILAGEAGIVVGARPISEMTHFSPTKRLLQKLGSWVVARVSRTQIPDAPSGFRAIHRDAAIGMYVFNDYTYTLETIIQAGRKHVPITSVPVKVNGDMRPSRLVRSVPDYLRRSLVTIFRIFAIYEPLRFFFLLAATLLLPAFLLGLRFVYYFSIGDGEGHIQSLLLATILAVSGFLLAIGGILADLVAANRALLEELRARHLRADIEGPKAARLAGVQMGSASSGNED